MKWPPNWPVCSREVFFLYRCVYVRAISVCMSSLYIDVFVWDVSVFVLYSACMCSSFILFVFVIYRCVCVRSISVCLCSMCLRSFYRSVCFCGCVCVCSISVCLCSMCMRSFYRSVCLCGMCLRSFYIGVFVFDVFAFVL